MELVCHHLFNYTCMQNPQDSPSLSVRSQHNAGAGVGGAGHPGAVNSKQHQHHQQGDDDDALDVHAKALLLLRLVIFHFLRLAHLHSTRNNGQHNSQPLPYLSTSTREKASEKGLQRKMVLGQGSSSAGIPLFEKTACD